MANTITVTNKVWNGTNATFSWSYTADLYSEQKLIEWSVGGVVKGSALGSAFSGAGTGSFAYSGTGAELYVTFAVYRWYLGSKGVQVVSPVNAVFTNTSTTTAPPTPAPITTFGTASIDPATNYTIATKVTTTQTSIILPAPSSGFYASTRIRNPTYIQSTATQRKITFDLDYSIFLAALTGVDGILYIQYSVNGVNTKTAAYQSRFFTNGTINVSIPDNSPYPVYAGNTVNVSVYLWGQNNVVWSQVVSSTFTLPSTTTAPNSPILQILPSSLPNNKLLKWNQDPNATQYNIETSTPSFPNWYSLTGDFVAGTNNDLGDGNWGLNVIMGTVAGDYVFRIRAKNSAGYSNYSPTILYTIDPIVTPPPPPPPPTITIPNAPILQMLVSSDPLAKLLKWNMDNNVTSYNIESSNPLTDPLWMSLTGNLTVGTDLGTNNDLGDQHWGIRVTMGTQDGLWKYRIRAQNSAGYSNYSNVVSYTISNNIPEPPPLPSDNKNLLSILTRVFAMGTGLGLLIKK